MIHPPLGTSGDCFTAFNRLAMEKQEKYIIRHETPWFLIYSPYDSHYISFNLSILLQNINSNLCMYQGKISDKPGRNGVVTRSNPEKKRPV